MTDCPDHGWEACMTRDGRCWVCALSERAKTKWPDPKYLPDDRGSAAGAAWRCICGSGDDAEWHTAACAIQNTPDEVWRS